LPVITFYNQHRSHEVEAGTNLRQAMLRFGITPYRGPALITNCRGNNFCGTCAVEVVSGGASPRSQDEEATLVGSLAVARIVDKHLRLSCQTSVVGDIVVKTHPQRLIDWPRTRERVGVLGIVSFFTVVLLGMTVYLVLDMVKLF